MGLALGGLQGVLCPLLKDHVLHDICHLLWVPMDLVFDSILARQTHLNLPWWCRGFQDLQSSHEVPEQVVALHRGADHATHALSCMYTDATTDVFAALNGPGSCGHGHRKSKQDHVQRLVLAGQGEVGLAGDVCITHRLNLVNVVAICQVIEEIKELTDELHHLLGLSRASEGREAAEVRLRNGRALVMVRHVARQSLDLLNDQRRHQSAQDSFDSLLHDLNAVHGNVPLPQCELHGIDAEGIEQADHIEIIQEATGVEYALAAQKNQQQRRDKHAEDSWKEKRLCLRHPVAELGEERQRKDVEGDAQQGEIGAGPVQILAVRLDDPQQNAVGAVDQDPQHVLQHR
mmetsp:Transcript_21172/g.47723  ORF Transcript_21172/g.47723 Transcript_21172/m.47723 type:complete len:346 (-) Transcript_21172:1666-2703(-)